MNKDVTSILVVDDTETTRKLLTGALTGKGYEVTSAASGWQAMELIGQRRFNLVLLDIMMPDIDGYTVLKSVRNQHTPAELPIIVVTIKHDPLDLVEALSLGANDYVTKPIDFPILFARIQTLLSHQLTENELRNTKVDLENRVASRTAELHQLNEGLKHEIEQRKRSEQNLRIEIKQRETMEKALRGSERRYRDLYDHLPSMFFTVDPQGKILSVNEFGAEQLGYTIGTLLNQPFSSLFKPNMHATTEQYITTCFQDQDTVHRRENRKLTKQGAELWFRDTARVVRDVSGKDSLFIICEDITEARILSEKLSYQATHDDLTSLVNRREFNKRLQRILDTTKLDESEHALCYLDLDEFKIINDSCGHSAGDELLRQLGRLLQTQVRTRDTLARLGGDEFGILMEHCSLEQANRLANTVRKSVKNFHFTWNGQQFSIGVSIGLLPLTKNSGPISSVLHMADEACYRAKKSGRNCIYEFRDNSDITPCKQNGLQWGLHIDRALLEKRFALDYQAIAPLNGYLEQGFFYELLIRMRDPRGKILQPSTFLSAARRLNRSEVLDRWVISALVQWLQNNPAQMDRLFLCSINLSAHSIAAKEFHDFIIRLFDSSGIPPTKICFEIPLATAAANLMGSQQLITSLKGLGYKFAIDDFGTKLSSYHLVKSLPVDYLKIDGELIKNIVSDETALIMAKSINEIGHVMDQKTIAKSVEDEPTYNKLKEIGFDYAQGYYIGCPSSMVKLASDRPLD
ncbi:MAG: EAL domain-containing protein [Gammaproteobacteria bacterium]|nr:EAL domain-containing protein [Gammaproteobacteria bacterium]